MVHIELHESGKSFRDVVVQSIDLTPFDAALVEANLEDAIILGCNLGEALSARAAAEGTLVFPRVDDMPFNPYPPTLYTRDTLMADFEIGRPTSYADTLDARVYARPSSIKVTLRPSSPVTSRSTSPTRCARTAYWPSRKPASSLRREARGRFKRSFKTHVKTATPPRRSPAQWSSLARRVGCVTSPSCSHTWRRAANTHCTSRSPTTRRASAVGSRPSPRKG